LLDDCSKLTSWCLTVNADCARNATEQDGDGAETCRAKQAIKSLVAGEALLQPGTRAAHGHRRSGSWPTEEENTQSSSGVSLLRNISIAPEKAANARPPPTAAFGPDVLASILPVTNPPSMPFVMSLRAR